MARKITLEMVISAPSPPVLVEFFKNEFPNGVEVTEELCAKYENVVPWGMFADEFLTEAGRSEFWKVFNSTGGNSAHMCAITFARLHNLEDELYTKRDVFEQLNLTKSPSRTYSEEFNFPGIGNMIVSFEPDEYSDGSSVVNLSIDFPAGKLRVIDKNGNCRFIEGSQG